MALTRRDFMIGAGAAGVMVATGGGEADAAHWHERQAAGGLFRADDRGQWRPFPLDEFQEDQPQMAPAVRAI